MTTMAASPIDIHQAGKYPIVLSDALLGKATKEVYTGVRYNHKPEISSNSPSSSLKPSDSDSTSYDLALKDNSDRYSYIGARTTSDGQYVLIFDPAKEHFVLHRIDSTFDMNLVSAPGNSDAFGLRSQYPQLETESKEASPPQRKPSKGKKNAAAKTEAPRKKVNVPKKAKPPVREPTPEEDESDDGFTVEDPDSVPTNQYQSQSSFQRQASEEISDEDEDAEHELYEEDEHNQDVDHLKLPSPANNAGGMSDEDFEADLEKELEAEFEEALKDDTNEADESDESEEE